MQHHWKHVLPMLTQRVTSTRERPFRRREWTSSALPLPANLACGPTMGHRGHPTCLTMLPVDNTTDNTHLCVRTCSKHASQADKHYKPPQYTMNDSEPRNVQLYEYTLKLKPPTADREDLKRENCEARTLRSLGVENPRSPSTRSYTHTMRMK